MERKNAFSKELMHKDYTPDRAARLAVADRMRDELKSQANKKWYQRNKEWKKKYNANYYRQHRDYWQEKYKTALIRGNSRAPYTYELSDPSTERQLNYNTRKRIQEDAQAWLGNGLGWKTSNAWTYAKNDLTDLAIAERMYKQSEQDYQHFMRNHQKTSVKEAWSDGAKQIRDAGKKFIKKLHIRFRA